MEMFFYIGAFLLMLVGLADVIGIIVQRLFYSGGGDMIHLVPLSGGDIEMELRGAIGRVRNIRGTGRGRIIAVDMGMDESSRSVCEIICRQYSVLFCKAEDVGEVLAK